MTPDLREFAESFFGAGNRLRWADIEDGSLPEAALNRLRPWLEDLRRAADPLMLPRVYEDGTVEWWGIAATPASLRVLREEILGFLGPSYTDFTGHPAILDVADPVAAAVQERYGARCICVRIPSGPVDKVRERLLLWRDVRRRRPHREAIVARPMGRVLREFEDALRVGQSEAAAACINELQGLGRLDAQNGHFLDILRLESASAWQEILSLGALPSLLGIRRPRRVTQALIRAVYVAELSEYEREGRPEAARERFVHDVMPAYGELFSSRAHMSAPEVGKCFLLLAATATPPRTQTRDDILAAWPVDAADRRYVEQLARLVVDEDARPHVDAADAWLHGDVDRAFDLACNAPPDGSRLRIALLCASSLSTTESARFALHAFEQVSEVDREQVMRNALLRGIVKDLRTDSVPGAAPEALVPEGWLQWAEALHGNIEWPHARRVAEQGVQEWSTEDFCADHDAAQTLADVLTRSLPEWATIVLRDSMPYLVAAFVDGEAQAALCPVYDAIAYSVLTDPQPGTMSLFTLAEVLGAWLPSGMSSREYGDLLQGVGVLCETLDSPAMLDGALEVLDTLASHPCPDSSARDGVWAHVVDILIRRRRHADSARRAMFMAICEDIGQPCPSDLRIEEVSNEEDALPEWLAGKQVALYSLNSGALRRVARSLDAMCPTVQVQTFDDKVGGSPSLLRAARTADLFVVATAKATHAATGFIDAKRRRDAATIRPSGKGSTSMLDVIRRHAQATDAA